MGCHTAFRSAHTGPAAATAVPLAAEAQGKLLTVCLSPEEAEGFVLARVTSIAVYKPV